VRILGSSPSRVLWLGVLSLAPALAAQLAPATAAQIAAEGLQRSRVMAFQEELCGDLGHRLTGSDNMTRACEWARDHFAAMGLSARIEAWDEWKVAWNREQWQGRILAPIALELQVATPAWTAGTAGQRQGRLVRLPKDDAAVTALVAAGEAVWLWGPRPGEQAAAWQRLAPLREQRLLLGTVQSAKSTGLTDARFANQIRVFGDQNVARAPFESRPTVPHIVVRDDQAEQLEKLLDGEAPVRAQFEIRNRFRRGPIAVSNVIADLPGTERPEEVVIVCAHLDSWHQAVGATDNGTGVCSTLEAARILTAAGLRPKRTIRFCLWTGEEQGLLGSQRYVVMHRQEMDKVSAVFNHDSGTNWAHSLTISRAMQTDLEAVFAPVMRLAAPARDHQGPVFQLNVQDKLPGFGSGSDHASFQAAGVPAWPWGLRGEVEYGYGWHSQWDTLDLVVPAYQAHNATVFALVAAGVAELPHLLSREGIERPQPAQDATALVEGRLGVTLDGLRITKLESTTGLAARAGMQVGDVLEEVDAKPVARPVDVWRLLRGLADGAAVSFTVQRAGKSVSVIAPAPPPPEAKKSGDK
jgi:carboxypeptidase Q